jgi:hypothetical protein
MPIEIEVRGRQEGLEEQAERMGQYLAREAFGKKGPGLDVSMTDLEQFFDAFVKGFSKGLYGETVQSQAGCLPESESCPECGQECVREAPDKPRDFKTVHGSFSWNEPRYFCSHCERLFFPPTAGSAD